MTTATISFHTHRWATLEVNYADGTFTLNRLECGRRESGDDLYERGYRIADHYASERGFRLDRYSRT